MERKFTTVNGKKTCYLEGGKGKTLLLLHGWARPRLKSDKALYLLAEHFHIIAPDFPGYGGSEPLERPHTIKAYKDFTLSFIRKLKPGKIHLVGSSMGSLVALTAATEQPQQFKKLILIGFSDNFARDFPLWGGKGSTTLLNCLNNPSACRLLSGKGGEFSKPAIACLVACSEGRKSACMNTFKLIKEFKSIRARVLLENITDILSHSYEDRVRKLTIPTAVICGEKDRLVIPKKCETPTGECPRFERIVVKGGKHAISVHKPKELTQAITGFIHR